MRPSDQGLGPRWSLQELRTFYRLLQAHGQEWEKLADRLPQRSCPMVRALFARHCRYLSLPEASVEGFCAIMMDQYALQDKQTMNIQEAQKKKKKEEKKEEAAAAAAALVGPMDHRFQDNFVLGSRKKRRLAKGGTVDQVVTLQRQLQPSENVVMQVSAPRGKQRKSTRQTRKAVPGRVVAEVVGLPHMHGLRLDLPWSHWFYSYLDADFFRRNEFIECLGKMGLAEITVAARPIWSSIRASMGRPRRLSRVFLTQEKKKLEIYRAVKRRVDHLEYLSMDRTWPYRCSPPLQPGMSVIVWMESERRFRFATVVGFRATEGTCQVTFSRNVSTLDATDCSLDNVMVLTMPPWSGKSEANSAEPKLCASTPLRRENGTREGGPLLLASEAADPIGARHHGEKVRAILAVNSLLHRKEKIISSMAKLNEHAAEQQTQLHEKGTMKSSLWTNSTTISSAAMRDLAWTNSRERRQLQKQHSWLAANLDATNKHLKTALLTLQSFSAIALFGAENSDTNLGYPSDSLKRDDPMPTETLTEDQIRWAMDFLSASQRKSAIVVAESASQVVKDDMKVSSVGSSANEARLGNVLPETTQLIANSITLMSVLHRHVAASPDVPPVVTQKLVERVLELLKPSHESNMDLYAELHAAADAAKLRW